MSTQRREDNWGATWIEKQRFRSRKPKLTAVIMLVLVSTFHIILQLLHCWKNLKLYGLIPLRNRQNWYST
jgi:membrane-anchored protein YejM (alkaline phosphatase superfamily)